MGSTGKTPNVYGIPATLNWCVASIAQLKGQVWGIIQNGGGGGGGTQNLEEVLNQGNTAGYSVIITDGTQTVTQSVAGVVVDNTAESITIQANNIVSTKLSDSRETILEFIQGIPGVSNSIKFPDDNGTVLLDSLLGVDNGIATLDNDGLVPVTQLPFSAIAYQGAWNAFTNTPSLADGSGTAGDFYFVSVAGTQDLGSGNITFGVGDMVVYNGSVWQKVGTPIPTTQMVESRSGAAYQLVLTDNQKLLKFPFTTGRNITVPLNATVPFPVGNRVDIMMMNDGQATIVGETGAVSIRSKGGNTKTNGKYTIVSIEKIDTNEWVLVGDLTS